MDLKGKVKMVVEQGYHNMYNGQWAGTDTMTDKIVDILLDEWHGHVDWYNNEIDYLKQRIAELELDALLHDEQAYGQPGKLNGAMLNIKKRGNFR